MIPCIKLELILNGSYFVVFFFGSMYGTDFSQNNNNKNNINNNNNNSNINNIFLMG